MSNKNDLLKVLGIESIRHIKQFAEKSGIPWERFQLYANGNLFPSGSDLEKICSTANISPLLLKLYLGQLDSSIIKAIQQRSKEVEQLLGEFLALGNKHIDKPQLVFQTELGSLYKGDCMNLFYTIEDGTVDLVFADPPFNLDKQYPSGINDNLKTSEYLEWCEGWIQECIRILKPGGSFFLWNLPKWNTYLSSILNRQLTFRHWITVDMRFRLPITGRLYPAHYSLLYYCKGKQPTTFHPDRVPMKVCPKCKNDLVDYGGYKHKMNPAGVNISDVWDDIYPVRHSKYKKRKGANELPIKLLDRIIEMASNENDLVFDPFGGAGTTYMVAELKNRRWIGIELGSTEDITNRFLNIEKERQYLSQIREDYNSLFKKDTLEYRSAHGLWTCDSVKQKSNPKRLKLLESRSNS
jgi:site-specific DNA-methyltransferase (adenine-specific)